MNTALTKVELRTHLEWNCISTSCAISSSIFHTEMTNGVCLWSLRVMLSSVSLASDASTIHMTGNTIGELALVVVGKMHGAVLSHNTVGPWIGTSNLNPDTIVLIAAVYCFWGGISLMNPAMRCWLHLVLRNRSCAVFLSERIWMSGVMYFMAAIAQLQSTKIGYRFKTACL